MLFFALLAAACAPWPAHEGAVWPLPDVAEAEPYGPHLDDDFSRFASAPVYDVVERPAAIVVELPATVAPALPQARVDAPATGARAESAAAAQAVALAQGDAGAR